MTSIWDKGHLVQKLLSTHMRALLKAKFHYAS